MDVIAAGGEDRDTVMAEGPSTVSVPKWFADLMDQVGAHLDQMEGLVQECHTRSLEVQAQFPELARAYSEALGNQHFLYDLALKGRAEIEKASAEIAELRGASNQFAEYVERALALVVNSAQAEFQSLRAELEKQVEKTRLLEDGAAKSRTHQLALRRKDQAREATAKRKTAAESAKLASLEKSVDALKAVVRDMQAQMAAQDDVWAKRVDLLVTELEKRKEELVDGYPAEHVRSVVCSWDGRSRPPPLNEVDAVMLGVKNSLEDAFAQGESSGKGKEPAFPRVSPGVSEAGGNNLPPLPPNWVPLPSSPSDSSSSSEDEGKKGKGKAKSRRGRSKEREDRLLDILEQMAGKLAGKPDSGHLAPIKLAPPPTFSGDKAMDFRTWITEVDRFLVVEGRRFPSTLHQIAWVGTLLAGRARTWFQDRERDLQAKHLQDNWGAFREALEARFLRTDEDHRDLLRMEELRYKGDIEDYLAKMEAYNLRAGAHGVVLKRIIRKGLPNDILDLIGVHEEPNLTDLDFLALVRRVGKRAEYAKSQRAGSSAGPSSLDPQRKAKDKKRKAFEASTADPPPSREGRDKKKARKGKPAFSAPPTGRPSSSGATGANATPRGSGKLRHSDAGEALKGIPRKVTEKRRKAGECARCGKLGHSWKFCRGEIVTGANTVAAATPRLPPPVAPTAATTTAAAVPEPATTTAQPGFMSGIAGIFDEEVELLDYEVRTLS